MKYLGPLVLGFLLPLLFNDIAHSHDWFTGTSNPATKQSCCGLSDCFALTSYDQLSEDAEFYIVTIREAFKPTDYAPIIPAGVYRFPKKDVLPARAPKPGEIGFYACIVHGQPRCFFVQAGS
jgi:hypothetical protein